MSQPSPMKQAGQPSLYKQRELENFILNIVLYISALFLVGAAALFLNALAPVSVRVSLLILGSILFYAAGIAFYLWIPKLRLASYSFIATGLALLPLAGLAVYRFLYSQGPIVWFLTSLLGTALIILGTALVRERAIAYLLITFFVSDILSSSKVLQLSLIWYFLALLVFACLLKFLLLYRPNSKAHSLHKGFLDSSRLFVPITMVAALLLAYRFEPSELSLLFALATAYCLIFARPLSLDIYLQLRIYSLFTFFFLATSFSKASWTFLPYSLIGTVLVCTAVLLLRLPRLALPWSKFSDAQASWYTGILISSYGTLLQTFYVHRHSSLASKDSWADFSIFLPRQMDGGILLAPWILPAFLLASLLLCRSALKQEAIFIMLALASLVFSLALLPWGASILLLESGILTLYLASRYQSGLLAKISGILVTLVGALSIIAQVFSLSASLVYLLLACLLAFSQYLLLRFRLKNSLATQDIYITCVLWIGSALTLLSLLGHLAFSLRYLARLEAFEITGELIFTGLGTCLTFILLAISFLKVIAHYSPSQEAASYQIGYALIAVLSVFYFGFATNTVALLALVLTLASSNLFALARYKTISKNFLSVLIRGLLLWGFSWFLATSKFSTLTISITLLAVICFLSLASLYLYKKTQRTAELVFGLVNCLLTLPLSIFALLSTENIFLLLLLALLPLAVSGTWLISLEKEACRIIFSLLPPFALYFGASKLAEQEALASLPKHVLVLGILLLFLLACKLLAVSLPLIYAPQQGQQDPLGRWGSKYNSSLVFPALFLLIFFDLSYELYYLLFPKRDSGITLVLVLALIFLVLGLQAEAKNRLWIWALGTMLTLVRFCIYLKVLSSFFAFYELTVVFLLLLALLKLTKKQKAQVLIWWAFGIQVLASFWLLMLSMLNLGYEKKIVLLLVTVFLLLLGALEKYKALIISIASLLTLQILFLSSGLTWLVLFLLGILLLALVIWRLLAREDQDEALPFSSPLAQEGQIAARQPWDPPNGADIKPFEKRNK